MIPEKDTTDTQQKYDVLIKGIKEKIFMKINLYRRKKTTDCTSK